MQRPGADGHWLDRYGRGYHAWTREPAGGFARRCGLVEGRFDADGRHFEGRADMSALLTARLSTGPGPGLSEDDLQRHVLLAFALLRLRHPLLRARAEVRRRSRTAGLEEEPWFTVAVPASVAAEIEEAASALTRVEGREHYGQADVDDFFVHSKNTARVVDPGHALARVFVLPGESPGEGVRRLHFIFVLAHQITDGLSIRSWMGSFVKLLNVSPGQLEGQIEAAASPEAIRSCLPPAQEDVYPPVGRSRALRRWYWAITVALRHVRRPLPRAFPNPLRRAAPLASARPMAPRYPGVLDYSRTPPLNTFFAAAELSAAATRRLHRLCREAGASIGAGCFVLVAMAMMALHEARHPDDDDDDDAPRPLFFVGAFPLNPRPFIGTARQDSVMLAFSNGIALPFLPSSLGGTDARFRLLARRAHAQLSVYRKRKPDAAAAAASRGTSDELAFMGIRGPGRLIASNYIDGVLRLHELPPPPNWSLLQSTCNVSSIGQVSWEPEQDQDHHGDGDGVVATLAASVEAFRAGVRARNGEFLVSVAGEGGVIRANVSYDGNAIDEAAVPAWAERMRTLLEEEEPSGAGLA
ncbi:hypothetical protein GGR56DRAFT_251254 [Xylariaceae sp. FL0804]|nr:hypothetical protein GGR56DRAFT_251254 [Xylariaceae sp. FL0804]